MKKTLDELKKTLKKLGGKVHSFDISYEVKLSMITYKDKWETAGANSVVHVMVGEGADSEEVYKAGYAYLKALVEETAGLQMKQIIQHKKDSTGQPTVAQPTQLHVPPEKEEGHEFGKLIDEAEQFYDGEQPEGTMITVARIYIHQGKKARCAFIHDTADYEDKGAVAFKDDLASVDLNIDALTAGRSYTADELGISRAVIVGEGRDAKVSELIK